MVRAIHVFNHLPKLTSLSSIFLFSAFHLKHNRQVRHIVGQQTSTMGFLRPVASFALASTCNKYGVFEVRNLARPLLSATCLRSQSDSTATSSYSVHTSFDEEIINKYDAFILDQFGVLHNGINALDGAIELVDHLFKLNKKLIILSNTSAPASKALAKLPKFGFGSHCFQDAVTSGEESSRYILQEYGSDPGNVKRALMFTWDASKPNNPRLTAPPEVYLEQCGNIQVATSVQEADFLLFHGSEVWYRGSDKDAVSLAPFIEEGSFENIDAVLSECQLMKIPAVCANPDFVVQTPSGDGVAYMPGKIAAQYESLGGSCMTFGKPAVEHFEACIRKLGLDKSRVAHVGDSLHHDISGAVKAGIPNIFVTSGIHKLQFGTNYGELPATDKLEDVMEEEGGSIRPTHVVPAFQL